MSISYSFARRFVGKPIMAYCRDGKRHYGIVQRVTPDSLHLMPVPYRGAPVLSHAQEINVTTAEQKEIPEIDIIQAGYPGGFYGGASGYGYGYPGSWGWGAGLVLPLYVLLAISLFWW